MVKIFVSELTDTWPVGFGPTFEEVTGLIELVSNVVAVVVLTLNIVDVATGVEPLLVTELEYGLVGNILLVE